MRNLIFILLIIQFACSKQNECAICPEPGFSFPDTGFFGANVLSDKITTIVPDTNYSFCARVSNGTLLVKVINDNSNTTSLRYFGGGVGWLIRGGEKQWDRILQTTSNADMTIDVTFKHAEPGAGLVTIEYYWDGDFIKQKQITW